MQDQKKGPTKNNGLTLLQQANEAFREKNYELALVLYQRIQQEDPPLEWLIAINISLTHKKLTAAKIVLSDIEQNQKTLMPDFSESSPESAPLREAFDAEYYFHLYPDIKEAGVDPFEHYIGTGWREGRNPNSWFDPSYYLKKYSDIKDAGIEPLTHYIYTGQYEGRQPCHVNELSENSYFSYLNKQNINNVYKTPFLVYQDNGRLQTDIRLIAWYLPQYHPIPINDSMWGLGFTEWNNVSKALPQYENHYQPRLPGELGYYDLRLIDVQKRQIELAKNYGLHGFCYHYYWFDGKKIMDTPLQQVIDNPELDFPFCINWANENWTKKWDGLDKDVFLCQNHSADDDLAFLESIQSILTDRRYIKVAGKPLLMLYRPKLFPNINDTVMRWREHARKIGIGELYLVMTHSFEHIDPTSLGFDAAVDFAPNNFRADNITADQLYFNPDFSGNTYDYASLLKYAKLYVEPEFTKFRSLCPSWDNEARKPGTSTSFHGSTPEKYERWLAYLIEHTRRYRVGDEKLIFVNAWNEWAEGAYLEPDRKFGYAYLAATYNALRDDVCHKKIILISHDAYYHGAQFLALNIAKMLKEYFNYSIQVLLCGEGGLIPDFEQVATTHHFYSLSQSEREDLILNLYQQGYSKAIANTSVVGDLVELLSVHNIEVLSLIHEMKSTINHYQLEDSISKISKHAKSIVFPAEVVKQDFLRFSNVDPAKISIHPQGLFRHNRFKYNKSEARLKLINELQISEEAKIVLNLAYGDSRKGIDLFVDTGITAILLNKNIHFLWVGHYEAELYDMLKAKILAAGCEQNFHFVGLQNDIDHYYSGSNLFFLTSREDPFPSVILDAMNVGLPVLAFQNAGGFVELIARGCGLLVAIDDSHAINEKLDTLLFDMDLSSSISEQSQQIIADEFCFIHYLFDLLRLLDEDIQKVSVVIPNYNYEIFIKDRIDSVLNQSYPLYEIIYLDDKSSDGSLAIAEATMHTATTPFVFHKNTINSGSVYKQWAKGIHSAKGDFIWIAEADDLASKDFIDHALKRFKSQNVALVYAQSAIIDESGTVLHSDVRFHTDAIDPERWKTDYVAKGAFEIQHSLIYRNTIPNVSACLFRAEALKESASDMLTSYRYCGDWYLYVDLLLKYDVAFISNSLNYFRKHSLNVTTNNTRSIEYIAEVIRIKRYILDRLVLTPPQAMKSLSLFMNDFIDNNPQNSDILTMFSSDIDSFSLAKAKQIVIVTFNDEYGGSEVLWFEIAQRLALIGHNIRIICKHHMLGANRFAVLSDLGIEIVELEAIDSNTLLDVSCDLVVFSTGDHNAGGALFQYCHSNCIDYIIINQLVKKIGWPDNQEFLQTLFEGYRNAKSTFFTSQNNISIFEEKMRQKLLNARIHFNPIDIDRNDYVQYPPVVDAYSIAFPARLLIIHKGQDLVLKVLSQTKWQSRNLIINFYGQGPDEHTLKEMVRKYEIHNVNFLGHVDSMRTIWEANHAFILTSHMEGLPIVLLSAMFAGRASIVTNVGGIGEVVADDYSGFISDAISVEAVDALLERAWSHRARWKQMGESARLAILKHYPADPTSSVLNIINS